MKDFWKRMLQLYPITVKQFEFYAEGELGLSVFHSLQDVPAAMQIGFAFGFIHDQQSDRFSLRDEEFELFHPTGDFIDNGQQVIEDLFERMEALHGNTN